LNHQEKYSSMKYLLKISKKDISEIIFAIENHMKMHKIRKSKRYSMYRNEYFQTFLKVHIADTHAREHNSHKFIMGDIPTIIPVLLIDGVYLMSIGITLSKRLGEIKEYLYKFQIELDSSLDELKTAALTYVNK